MSKRNFRNFHKEIHSLKTRKRAKNNGNGHVIHSPQDSSVSSSSLKSFKTLDVAGLSPVENSGNVENRFGVRAVCERQVYASLEVAEGMVVSLKSIGITGRAERCGQCRLIHVLESKP